MRSRIGIGELDLGFGFKFATQIGVIADDILTFILTFKRRAGASTSRSCKSVGQKNVKNGQKTAKACQKSVKTCHKRMGGLYLSICLSVGYKMSKKTVKNVLKYVKKMSKHVKKVSNPVKTCQQRCSIFCNECFTK